MVVYLGSSLRVLLGHHRAAEYGRYPSVVEGEMECLLEQKRRLMKGLRQAAEAGVERKLDRSLACLYRRNNHLKCSPRIQA